MFHKKIIKIIYLTTLILFYSKLLANETSLNDNIVIHKKPQNISQLVVKDFNFNDVDLNEEKGNIVIINFWATWCAPCKEEMPSLDQLQINNKLFNLKIFPINIGQDKVNKAQKFFDDLDIKNLEIYFDTSINLAKILSLRGVPTSILINKDGQEFARIIGSIDFNDVKFINWLSSYN